ncbi:MAG: hypothetical protein IJW24_03165 [Clostridia bacterium]|nr:hypothetical protein [Clostridia bacterium]
MGVIKTFYDKVKKQGEYEELEVADLSVADIWNHQATMCDENGRWNGTSKAIPTNRRVIVQRTPDNTGWQEVESGKVYIDQIIINENGKEIINPKALTESGHPIDVLFVQGTEAFEEVFEGYGKKKISRKGISSLNAQLNPQKAKTEEQEQQ